LRVASAASIRPSAAAIASSPQLASASAKTRLIRMKTWVLRLWLSGWPLRGIAAHPKVQLSKRGVELALRRQLAQ
jgi:hypothetical protein